MKIKNPIAMKTLTQLLSLAALLTAKSTSVAGCADPCNLRIHDGPTPYLVYVRWDAPTNAVAQYIIANGTHIFRNYITSALNKCESL